MNLVGSPHIFSKKCRSSKMFCRNERKFVNLDECSRISLKMCPRGKKNKKLSSKWRKSHDSCWNSSYFFKKGAVEEIKMLGLLENKIKFMNLAGYSHIFEKKVPHREQNYKFLQGKWKKTHEYWWISTHFLNKVSLGGRKRQIFEGK